jgi:uncharacterized protein (DUF1015 family)
MLLKPFAALRPIPKLAAEVAAVPYDVVDTAEARALAAGKPLSFLHVTRPEIDLPEGTPSDAPAVYAGGLAAFRKLQADGVLVREDRERIYVYRQTMAQHAQTGVVACCSVADYAANTIRKHERTRQDKEDDRTRHLLALNANAGPVFLTYRGTAAIDVAVSAVTATPPLYDFTAPDGIRHTVWTVAGDPDRWVAAFGAVPVAYVADGHHRAAAAVRAASERQRANPGHTGREEYNWFLAVLFPAGQLRILPYNRCVRDLNGLSPERLLAAVGERFALGPHSGAATPRGPRQVCMYVAGRWYTLSWPDVAADPVGRLDVSVLQQRLLAPVLGIEDPRTSTRIRFVGGIRGTDELKARVDRGEDAVAFSMYPVTVDQVMEIADAGQIMPPKSTWFEPKLRSGLLIHTLDER